MAQLAPAHDRPRRWRRRLAIAGTVIAAVLAIAMAVLAYFLQPARLTALLLDSAGKGMKLDLRTTGPGRFTLRPGLRLVLPGLSATTPGGKTPLFRAGEVELAVPWDTLRGKSTAINRIALIAPDIDLPALNQWAATQPPSTQPVKLPTLTHGLAITNGSLRGDGWSLRHFNLSIPTLADGRPATLTSSGDLVRSGTTSKFVVNASGAAAGVGQGVRVDDLKLAMQASGDIPSLQVSGHLRNANAIDIDLRGALQRMPAQWVAALDSSFGKPGDAPFAITLRHQPAAMPAPAFAGDWQARFSLGDGKRQPALALTAQAKGELMIDASVSAQISRWPDAWPGLPAALPDSPAPLLAQAAYHGSIVSPVPITFAIQRGDTHLQGQAKLADLRAWLRDPAQAILPPLQATLDTPTLEFPGVRLQGVHAELADDAPAPVPSATPPAASPKRTPKP